MKTSILDRLLPLLERYAAGREAEKVKRRAMLALKCQMTDRGGRCFMFPGTHCQSCQRRQEIFLQLHEQQKADRALLRRIEALSLQLSTPETPEPPAPKPLLDMMTGADCGR